MQRQPTSRRSLTEDIIKELDIVLRRVDIILESLPEDSRSEMSNEGGELVRKILPLATESIALKKKLNQYERPYYDDGALDDCKYIGDSRRLEDTLSAVLRQAALPLTIDLRDLSNLKTQCAFLRNELRIVGERHKNDKCYSLQTFKEMTLSLISGALLELKKQLEEGSKDRAPPNSDPNDTAIPALIANLQKCRLYYPSCLDKERVGQDPLYSQLDTIIPILKSCLLEKVYTDANRKILAESLESAQRLVKSVVMDFTQDSLSEIEASFERLDLERFSGSSTSITCYLQNASLLCEHIWSICTRSSGVNLGAQDPLLTNIRYLKAQFAKRFQESSELGYIDEKAISELRTCVLSTKNLIAYLEKGDDRGVPPSPSITSFQMHAEVASQPGY